ncbi:hypothetical protein G9P44_006295 [Scheffersomyces stipitis]|nr:hypothetical protein G9P44_006295 [Scheffersomyces stipitis]
MEDELLRIKQLDLIRSKMQTVKDQSSRRDKMNEYLESSHFRFQQEKQSISLNKLKEAMQLVYPQEHPLVSIDVEAYERSLGKVTEIGVVIYDPQVSPGSAVPLLKPYHIIIQENLKLVNGRYVPDKKDRFMGGTSHVLRKKDAEMFVSAVIEKYINSRNGVLVGHHIEGDVKWLRSIGVNIKNDTAVVDTFRLFTISRSSGGTLRGVLREINVPHGNLHNAANDAYYTLIAAMTYCDPHHRLEKNLDQFVHMEKKSAVDKKMDLFSRQSDVQKDDCRRIDPATSKDSGLHI